jgi:excisionase family DNA binding protein
VGAERTQSPRPCGPGPNGNPPNGGLLTADDLAARWQVPKSHVYRLTRSGAVPAVKLGRYYRYEPGAIERFEAAGGVAADG